MSICAQWEVMVLLSVVDASEAGHGNLEIMVNGGYVECAAQSVGHQTFKAQFTPKQAKKHTIEINFNGKPVRGNFRMNHLT